MDGNADRTALVGNGAGDGLTNPPYRIGAEFKAFGVVKLFHGAQQAQIPLLDEVK